MRPSKQVSSLGGRLFTAFVLLVIPAVVLYSRGPRLPSLTSPLTLDTGLIVQMEDYISRNIPFRDTLNQLQLRLRLFGGQREQRGVFICGDSLLKQIDPPIDWYVERNRDAVLRFPQELGVNTFLTLIPTASTISQEKLPPYAYSQMHNQKQFIEQIYNEMAGRVSVVDAYTALFNHRSEYLYYRTENNLTSVGGYYVYSAMSGKLGVENSAYRQFDILYAGNGYAGDLYAQVPYHNARPDIFPLFRYASGSREYTVTHHRADNNKTYHTLYPLHLLTLNQNENVYLGGISAIVDIHTASPERIELPALLVFGDRTALSYLPFLANHYQRITFVDLFQMTDAQYEEIDVDSYAQVMFAYSVESFMHTDIPYRAVRFTG